MSKDIYVVDLPLEKKITISLNGNPIILRDKAIVTNENIIKGFPHIVVKKQEKTIEQKKEIKKPISTISSSSNSLGEVINAEKQTKLTEEEREKELEKKLEVVEEKFIKILKNANLGDFAENKKVVEFFELKTEEKIKESLKNMNYKIVEKVAIVLNIKFENKAKTIEKIIEKLF